MLREEMDKVDPNIAYTLVGVQSPASRYSDPVPLEGRFCSSGGKESYVGARLTFGTNMGFIQAAAIRTRTAWFTFSSHHASLILSMPKRLSRRSSLVTERWTHGFYSEIRLESTKMRSRKKLTEQPQLVKSKKER